MLTMLFIINGLFLTVYSVLPVTPVVQYMDFTVLNLYSMHKGHRELVHCFNMHTGCFLQLVFGML